MKYQILNLNNVSETIIIDNIIPSRVFKKLLSVDALEKNAQLKSKKLLLDANNKIKQIENHIIEKYLEAEISFKEKMDCLSNLEREKMISSTIKWHVSSVEVEKQIAKNLEEKIKDFIKKNLKIFLAEADLSSRLVQQIEMISTDNLDINSFNIRINQIMYDKIKFKMKNIEKQLSVKYKIDNDLNDTEAYLETDLLTVKIDLSKDINKLLSLSCLD